MIRLRLHLPSSLSLSNFRHDHRTEEKKEYQGGENSGPYCRSAMATALALLLHRHHRLFLLLLLWLLPGSEMAPKSDAEALLLLKSSFANATALSSWNPAAKPCSPNSNWAGVVCLKGVVTGLRLSDMGLSGEIDVDALSYVAKLRSVSFASNYFSGAIPALSRLHELKAIYLSHNRLSGDIPDNFFDGMNRLKKLWLDGNDFTGPIPSSIAEATELTEVRLENNHFAGELPLLPLPSLSSFNVSNNNLEGVIPGAYAKFGESSFMGNEDLCGGVLGPCELKAEHDKGSGKVAAVFIVAVILVCLVVYIIGKREKNKERGIIKLEKYSRGMAAGEVSPGLPQNEFSGALSIQKDAGQTSTMGTPSSSVRSSTSGGVGELVMVSDRKGAFGLPDLMRAEAEVMGSGGLGSAYKAVMANGVAVVVKRLRNMNRLDREHFDAEFRRFGGFSHPNVLPPLAYHFRKDEKLVVFELIPKGSLLYVLHCDRGLDHACLDWPTRAKIARGVARGLAYLHAELPSDEAPHGNLKSGNVLLAPDFEPLLVDYGFLALVNPTQAAATMQAHRSPEAASGGPVTPRSDVYCLGVIVLELLTGKFPTQYLAGTMGGTDVVGWAAHAASEGREAEILDPAIVAEANASSLPEMKRLIQVGLECAVPDPEQRLKLREAVERIEEVAAEAEKSAPPSRPLHVRDGQMRMPARRPRSVGEMSARRTASVVEGSEQRGDEDVPLATS